LRSSSRFRQGNAADSLTLARRWCSMKNVVRRGASESRKSRVVYRKTPSGSKRPGCASSNMPKTQAAGAVTRGAFLVSAARAAILSAWPEIRSTANSSTGSS
jgi:hypothetical protein